MNDWQDAPLDEDALRRIEDAAGMVMPPTPEDRKRVRPALWCLANLAIHRAFDRQLSAKDVGSVRVWANKTSLVACANLDRNIARVHRLGRLPCPPRSFRGGKALAEWLAFYESPKPRGRQPLRFDAQLTHRLAVCFWHLYRFAPDSSRGSQERELDDYTGGSHRLGGAARFVRAFYDEIGNTVQKLEIADPKLRKRRCTWRTPNLEVIAKRLRPIAQQRAWRRWVITPDGQILAISACRFADVGVEAVACAKASAHRPWMRRRLADVLAPQLPDERQRHLAALYELTSEDDRNAYISAHLTPPRA